MSNGNEDILLTHNYDGIEEYDNPMPGWWSFIFITNIIWAGVYVTGISLGLLPTYEVDLRADMAVQKKLEDAAAQDLPPITEEVLVAGIGDNAAVERGATVYKMNCAVCHGNVGQGLIGPNLTDDAWLNGDGTVVAVHTVIANGTSKGMPPWGKVLGRDDQIAVTAFVTSLHGTSPADAKPAEGTVFKDGQPVDGAADAAEKPAEEAAPAVPDEGAAPAEEGAAVPAADEEGSNG